MAIGHRREVAAALAVLAEFARRGEVAVALAMAPVVALADPAVEADGVGVEGVALVVAIDVARQGVAEQAAQEHAADHRASIAVARRAADQAAADGGEHRADAGAAMAVPLVIAFAIDRRGRRAFTVAIVIGAAILIGKVAIMALAVVIAVMVGAAVIT